MRTRGDFLRELGLYGPGTERGKFSLKAANEYCCRMAKSHYENFSVMGILLPRRFRSAFYSVYAYCRWADDLGDELRDTALALELLDWWENELYRAEYWGRTGLNSSDVMPEKLPFSHPVFVAMSDLFRRFSVPVEPFADLLQAFRSDCGGSLTELGSRSGRDTDNEGFRSGIYNSTLVEKLQCYLRSVGIKNNRSNLVNDGKSNLLPIHYQTFDELEEYCRYSANPVGRILLYLVSGNPSEEQLHWSDCICTALQWANFWQDVSIDAQNNRCYIPVEIQEKYDSFTDVMRELVARTRKKFDQGRPLIKSLPKNLRLCFSLFLRGGGATLDAIEKIGYKTDQKRPTVSKAKKIQLFLQSLLMK